MESIDPNDVLEEVRGRTDLTTPAQTVLNKAEYSYLLDRLEGRNGRLRTSKPTAEGDTGFVQFVWRVAAFHSGLTSSHG